MTTPPVRARRRSPRGRLSVSSRGRVSRCASPRSRISHHAVRLRAGRRPRRLVPESERAAFAAGFGIVAAVLLGIVVVAAVGSRWAAFTLALVALLFSAYIGVGLASGLHSAQPRPRASTRVRCRASATAAACASAPEGKRRVADAAAYAETMSVETTELEAWAWPGRVR